MCVFKACTCIPLSLFGYKFGFGFMPCPTYHLGPCDGGFVGCEDSSKRFGGKSFMASGGGSSTGFPIRFMVLGHPGGSGSHVSICSNNVRQS
jgi:hypothetical protein